MKQTNKQTDKQTDMPIVILSPIPGAVEKWVHIISRGQTAVEIADTGRRPIQSRRSVIQVRVSTVAGEVLPDIAVIRSITTSTAASHRVITLSLSRHDVFLTRQTNKQKQTIPARHISPSNVGPTLTVLSQSAAVK